MELETFQKTVTAAGTAEQLAQLIVPPDCKLTIKAKHSNAGRIRIGKSQAKAQSTSESFSLGADQAVSLGVRDAAKVWIDATNSGDGIEGVVEVRA